ncbi:hypothetical protein B5S30_g5031 [[Candida] boidinii]|nr:hypothetical protein B5S30_g5031 [[Candida] boidinii]
MAPSIQKRRRTRHSSSNSTDISNSHGHHHGHSGLVDGSISSSSDLNQGKFGFQNFQNKKPRLVINQPTQEETIETHDEMDIFSFRNSSVSKFKLNNDLLENLILKYLPIDSIIPPKSFPDATINSKKIINPDEIKNKNELELKKLVSDPLNNSSIFGNLSLMKLKDDLLNDLISQEENLLSESAPSSSNDLKLSDKYKFEKVKTNEIGSIFKTYNVKDIEKYNDLFIKIKTECKEKFNKIIDVTPSVQYINQSKIYSKDHTNFSFEDYKKIKKEAFDIMKQKKEKEDMEKRKNEMELLEKEKRERQAAAEAAEKARKLQEEKELKEREDKKRFEEEQKQKEAENQRQLQLLQEQQEQQQQQQQQLQEQEAHNQQDKSLHGPPLGNPTHLSIPPQAQIPIPTSSLSNSVHDISVDTTELVSNHNDFVSHDNPHTTVLSFQMNHPVPDGDNDYDVVNDNDNIDDILNVYNTGDDLIIDDGTAFDALADPVFLSNLDGNLDDGNIGDHM